MIYLIITIILDFLLFKLIPGNYNNLSYFYPMIFIASISVLNNILGKKVYYLVLIIMGMIYDYFYSELLFVNLIIFLFIGFIISTNSNKKLIIIILYSLLSIIFYDFLMVLFFNIFNYNNNSFLNFIYKVKHSLILNVFYVLLSIFVLKSRIFINYKKLKY